MTEPTFQADVLSREAQHTTVETPKIFPEVLSSPHDILGKEYSFNGVSFTILGIQPTCFDSREAIEDLQPDVVSIVNVQKQRIPVIPFQGGLAYITKIQIGDEIISGSTDILKRIIAVEYAPQGWMLKYHLDRELGIKYQTIAKYADSHRSDHTEWFHRFRFARGGIFEFYSPELCEIIRSRFQIEKAPDNWKTARNLAAELGISSLMIERYARYYSESHQESYQNFRTAHGSISVHYSLKLCEIIKNEIINLEGWMTNNSLANELGIDRRIINRRVESFRESHAEWFRVSRHLGRPTEYYSPELCGIIRTKISQSEQAPQGWMTKNELAKKLGFTWLTMRTYASKYRRSNPEWFRKYKSSTGTHEHLSPELCAIVRYDIEKIKHVPNGWLSEDVLMKKLRIRWSTLKNHINVYRLSHPEWFQKYRSGNCITEYCAPELRDIIYKEIHAKDRPLGWMTNGALANELIAARETTTRYANYYRQSHPEWFHDYKALTGRMREHYAPQLCDLIRQAVKGELS